MKNVLKKQRLLNVVERLEAQLEKGVKPARYAETPNKRRKTDKFFTEPLTTKDIRRIKNEIEIIQNKII